MDFEIAGKLFPNLLTMITQLAATGVLFLCAYKWLWPSVHKMIEARALKVQTSLNEAEEKQKQSELLLADANAKLREADHLGKELVETAKKQAEATRKELLDKAALEANQKLEAAREEIERERAEMREALQREIVEVAFAATHRLLEKKPDAGDRYDLEHFVSALKESHGPN
ncbi:MAG: F0F1 ATP synthase subunit B [Erysipelotrichaceae bacterium]|jgi:F-type H+-transporting ATPase subunit b|nr:F0F1 ATP synthase subunit B [Erysipelotrichaceae bacterium]